MGTKSRDKSRLSIKDQEPVDYAKITEIVDVQIKKALKETEKKPENKLKTQSPMDNLRENSRSRSPPGNIKKYINKTIDKVLGTSFYGFKLPSYHSSNSAQLNILKKNQNLKSSDKRSVVEHLRS